MTVLVFDIAVNITAQNAQENLHALITNTSPENEAARKITFSLLQWSLSRCNNLHFQVVCFSPFFSLPPPPTQTKISPEKLLVGSVTKKSLHFCVAMCVFCCSFPCFLLQEVLSQFNHIFSHLLGHAGIGRLSLGAFDTAVTGDEKLMEVSVPSNLPVMSATC